MQPFKPEPQRLYRQIAERLRSAILAGDYRPGDRLPAERDLAHILRVSRPSVREALIALEVDGWVEVRTGSGVYVLERTPSATELTASDEWGPLELIRARRLVEGETAALAAEYAQPMHLQAMHTALAAMCADADAGRPPLDSDRAFHTALVQACGNSVLMDTVQGYWEARHSPMFERLGNYFETPQSWRAAIDEHQAILSAVQNHDPTTARLAMHRHMDQSHARLNASWVHGETS
ncbi:MAG: hypothetical protein RJA34_576 [Pseudomonadota bacterium]|jgi:DNA-binding FadR family transcriptional regulator